MPVQQHRLALTEDSRNIHCASSAVAAWFDRRFKSHWFRPVRHVRLSLSEDSRNIYCASFGSHGLVWQKIKEPLPKASLGVRLRLSLAEDSRTTDFRLGLFILILIRMASHGQLCLLTYLTEWLAWPQKSPSDRLSNQTLVPELSPWPQSHSWVFCQTKLMLPVLGPWVWQIQEPLNPD